MGLIEGKLQGCNKLNIKNLKVHMFNNIQRIG